MAGSDASNIGEYVQGIIEYVPVVAGAHILQGLLFTAFAGAAVYVGTRVAMRQIAHGDFAFQQGVVTSSTSYWPDVATDTENGGKYTCYDQQITNISRVGLGAVFNPDNNRQGKAVHQAVKKARKSASADSPIVYSHLSDDLKEDTLEGVKEAVCRLSRSYFSQIFNSETDLLSSPPSEDYRPVEDIVLPLYVVEPGANGREAEKILYLRLNEGTLPTLPPFEQVRFPDLEEIGFTTSYISDPDHIHADRYRLMEKVLSDLKKPENVWMSQLGVSVPSGKFRHVETGEIIHASGSSSYADPSLVS